MARTSDKSTQAIIEAANEWLLVMHEETVSSEDEKQFVAWLRESPVHVREYLQAERVFATLEGVDADQRIDVEALLSSDDDSVVELLGPDLSPPGSRTMPVGTPDVAAADETNDVRRKRRPVLWATAASVLLAVVAALWVSNLSEIDTYTTGLGEQRRLVLEDGSVIDMNTQSTLRVAYTESTRDIRLDQGEALFTVAKDPDRPFVVSSEHATVRAIGTQFNVQKRNGEVRVTVIEGRVAVDRVTTPGGPAGSVGVVDATPVELGAGDAAEVLPAAPIKTQAKVNTERTVAWTERRLIFENEPLSAVVAEFNRYNPRQLVINDVALNQERISAVFDADQPDALVRFLEQNAGIVVTESQTQLIIRSQE